MDVYKTMETNISTARQWTKMTDVDTWTAQNVDIKMRR